ncbi:MAG: DNA-processing protein DprA [Bacteroidota bacterium]
MNRKEKISQIALSQTEGIGNATIKRLVTHAGSAEAILQCSFKELVRLLGGYKRLAANILREDALAKASDTLLAHERAKIDIITLQEDAYPERLARLPDAPFIIYTRGHTQLNTTKVVSVVGTRKATSYGKQVVDTLMDAFREYSVLVVSGLAYGIDVHAHQRALEYGLPTVGVLAGGVDAVYPAGNKDIAVAMLQNGCLLSEHPMCVRPEVRQFAARNRIIAGLSDLTIVVEAGERSGALITAHFANEYHREVFAVPGRIYDARSQGCLNLIKTHQAHLLSDISDIVHVMNWDQNVPTARRLNLNVMDRFTNLTNREKNIVQTLDRLQKEVALDELSYQANMPYSQMAGVLLGLEVKNVVRFMPGKKFKLAV